MERAPKKIIVWEYEEQEEYQTKERVYPFTKARYNHHGYCECVTIELPETNRPWKVGWVFNRIRSISDKFATIDSEDRITVYIVEKFVAVLPPVFKPEAYRVETPAELEYFYKAPPRISALPHPAPLLFEELLLQPRDRIITTLNELKLGFGQPGGPPFIGGVRDANLDRLHRILVDGPPVTRRVPHLAPPLRNPGLPPDRDPVARRPLPKKRSAMKSCRNQNSKK